MNARTLSVVALSNRDFDCLEDKLREAAEWIALAAAQGSQLVVLPEMINRYCGDGAGNPRLVPARQAALHDWRAETAIVIEAARKAGVALALPVVHLEGEALFNSFFLLNREGDTIGRYDKACPTPPELAAGMVPAQPAIMQWEGITLGGAICFDTCFPEVIEEQIAAGAELILVPSLWPGGRQLNHFARHHSVRFAVAYPAWSRIIDIDGLEMIEGGYRHETLRFGFGVPVYTATINFGRVALFGNDNQQKIKAISEKYGQRVRITFEQENCLFFLDTLDPALPEASVVEEFGLIPANEYFSACRRQIRKARGM
jgi:predicted amidohydrolase